MNNIERCLLLETSSAVTSSTKGFGAWLDLCQRLWQSLTKTLERTAALRIWQRLDRFGNLYWHGYDPATGRSTSSGSEAELRAWIEELRYRK